MKRTHFIPTLCVTAALSTSLLVSGCGRADEPATTDRQQGEAGQAATAAPAQTGMPEHGQDLTVTGCLTANIDGRSYALTPGTGGSTPGAQMPGRETVTYELVGNTEDFRRHANTVVTARGREDASASREAEVERKAETEQRPAAGSNDTPTVETKEEIEVNVRRLHVASVVGTGDACPSLGAEGSATDAPKAGAGASKGGGAARRPGGGSQ